MSAQPEQGRTAVTRALAWKEWREQRPVVLAGLGLAALLPFFIMAGSRAMRRDLDLPSLADILPGFFLGILCPLFAAISGGATIAHEIGEGTAEFLLSRPASRPRIWAVKVGMAAGCTAMVAAGSLLLAAAFGALVGGEGVVDATLNGLQRASDGAVSPSLVLGITVLLFASSIFFSTILSRPMSAAAGGVAASCGVMTVILAVWARLDVAPRLEPGWIAAQLLLIVALVLVASLNTFCRGELLRGRAARQGAVMGALMALAGAALVSLPVIHAQTRLTPAQAVLMKPVLSPTGDTVISTAMDRDFGSPQVWMFPVDGGGMTRLTGRLTSSPFFSPDARLVGYVSARGWLGLMASRAELRAVAPDGHGDRRLAGDLAPLEALLEGEMSCRNVSPSSDRLAWVQNATLRILPLGEVAERRIELRGTPLEVSQVVGWGPDGSEVVLLASRWSGPRPRTALGAVRVSDGSVRLLAQDDDPLMMGFDPAPCAREGVRHVPFLVYRDGSVKSGQRDPAAGSGSDASHWELSLVDVVSGQVRLVTDTSCFSRGAVAPDGLSFVYAVCPPKDQARRQAMLHRLDLDTVEDRLLASVDGRVTAILPSPAGDRFLLHRMTYSTALPPVIVDASGVVTELAPGWVPLGWSGGRRIVLADDSYRATRLALLDSAGGAPRAIYPPGSDGASDQVR